MGKVVIVPSCDDSNRGDQALVWRTLEVVRQAGLGDEVWMLSTEAAPQTQNVGIHILEPILKHPQNSYPPKSNLRYSPMLLLVWGLIAVRDFSKSVIMLTKYGRHFARWTLTENELATLEVFEQSEACFVKGGGFIHSTGSVSDAYRAYYTLFHVFLAHSFGKPTYVMPNSFGPFEGRLFKFIVRRAISRCSLITARETISQDALKTLDISAELYPDLAFALQKRSGAEQQIQDIRNQRPKKKIVALTARPYRFPGSKHPVSAYRAYVAEMAEFIIWLTQNQCHPVLVEHVLSTGAHESDKTAIADILAQLSGVECDVISDASLDCRDLKAIYGACDYVVGTRFHSVIFSLAEGVPALAIGYGGNKGQGIMQDIGLPDQVLPIEEFTARRAASLFRQLMSEDVRVRVIEATEGIQDRLSDLAERVRCLHFLERTDL